MTHNTSEQHLPADATKARVQQQFGAYADRYATSAVHARGESLDRLVDLVQPQSDDLLLDVATAAGHTALRFATHVRQVVGADLTPPTLETARRLAHERGQANLTFVAADAEHLSFPAETFDIVTCRLALHHMPDAARAIAEMARVCRTGGRVALADNIVPEDEDTAAWVNQFETIRDPSHFRLWPLPAIVGMFEAAGLHVAERQTLTKTMDFENWAWRMDVPPADKGRLRAMLFDAPPAVQQWLSPREVDGRLKFNLVEGVVLGRK